MNREALARVLDRTRTAEAPAATDQTAAVGPQAKLWVLLDRWTCMNEVNWSPEAVDRLKDEILDLFASHPEADAWFREWRAAHPEARLL